MQKQAVRLSAALGIALVLGAVFVMVVVAQTTVIVTPTDLMGWGPANVRADSTVDITGTQPRSGDGSLQFTTVFATSGQDKADFELVWSPLASGETVAFPNRTLNNLDAFAFEVYRDSASTGAGVADHLHPVLRLLYFYDANGNQVFDVGVDTGGLLIYEGIYQTPPIDPFPTDAWQSLDVLNEEFWMFVSVGPGGTGVVQNYDLTLADWLSGQQAGQGGDPTPPDLSTNTTYIVGINTGVGSGWNDDFLGFVDNVTVGFANEEDTTYNFELEAQATEEPEDDEEEEEDDDDDGETPPPATTPPPVTTEPPPTVPPGATPGLKG